MILPKESIEYMDRLSLEGEPFFFMLDFELNNPLVYRLSELPSDIYSNIIPGKEEVKIYENKKESDPSFFEIYPMPIERYEFQYNRVKEALQYGDSFLLNLTFASKVLTNYSLKELYHFADQPYSLLYKDQFLVQSPECFIKIMDNRIFTFPMKGTIDASIDNAKEKIINDEKELAEHYTIVDLLRNDLSIVAKNVSVDRFRFIDRVDNDRGSLLQVSSQISGHLRANFKNKIGSVLASLLPAGSISGAPKKKTVSLIQNIESSERGYYTGVFGVFDGKNLDSGVMIRILKNQGDHFQYHSGGGITFMSNLEEEYQEAIQKIYAPAGRVHTHKRRQDASTVPTHREG